MELELELATEYFIQGHRDSKEVSQRDHSSIDKRSHGCHDDLRTSDHETVRAIAPISEFHFSI
jgi:hypothetical protein